MRHILENGFKNGMEMVTTALSVAILAQIAVICYQIIDYSRYVEPKSGSDKALMSLIQPEFIIVLTMLVLAFSFCISRDNKVGAR